MKNELQAWIFRSQALSLYRTYLRSIRDVPRDVRGEVAQEIRRQFEASRTAPKDVHTLKHLLSDGRMKLKQLRDTLNLRQ
jgi:hypothetical protein